MLVCAVRRTHARTLARSQVEFLQGVDFISNECKSSEDIAAGIGGAVAVGPGGVVDFRGDMEFNDNKAQSGGSGGAIANYGTVSFWDRSGFYFNTAGGGGDLGSTTTASRGSGGAIANFGSMNFEKRSEFQFNTATGMYGGAQQYGYSACYLLHAHCRCGRHLKKKTCFARARLEASFLSMSSPPKQCLRCRYKASAGYSILVLLCCKIKCVARAAEKKL